MIQTFCVMLLPTSSLAQNTGCNLSSFSDQIGSPVIPVSIAPFNTAVVVLAAPHANDGPVIFEIYRAEDRRMVNELKHRAFPEN